MEKEMAKNEIRKLEIFRDASIYTIIDSDHHFLLPKDAYNVIAYSKDEILPVTFVKHQIVEVITKNEKFEGELLEETEKSVTIIQNDKKVTIRNPLVITYDVEDVEYDSGLKSGKCNVQCNIPNIKWKPMYLLSIDDKYNMNQFILSAIIINDGDPIKYNYLRLILFNYKNTYGRTKERAMPMAAMASRKLSSDITQDAGQWERQRISWVFEGDGNLYKESCLELALFSEVPVHPTFYYFFNHDNSVQYGYEFSVKKENKFPSGVVKVSSGTNEKKNSLKEVHFDGSEGDGRCRILIDDSLITIVPDVRYDQNENVSYTMTVNNPFKDSITLVLVYEINKSYTKINSGQKFIEDKSRNEVLWPVTIKTGENKIEGGFSFVN